MNSKAVTAAVVVLVAAGVLASYASPYWTLHQMRAAIDAKDVGAFSSYVNFPAVQDSIKSQLTASMRKKLGGAGEADDNLFANLGMAIGAGVINRMVDALVSPESVMGMMARGKTSASGALLGQLPPQSSDADSGTPQSAASRDNDAGGSQRPDYSMRYENWSTVTATAKQGDKEQGKFIFRRDGLLSWKLVGLDMHMDN
ncbi:DUF2939 domain-containing protein [Ralstonia sp. UBA689]|uniref:DUF2939 domain-containing protein n=1 Tax=Ralstonia sp. UBA689 TaxID=1947373 RepID=UPI0025F8E9FF|nr:DUF2939 domain-containing protein [Ralstonia sp. UBA689]